MNPFDFALSIVRAPFLQKLKDRTFQTLIGTAFASTTAAIAAWQTEGLSPSDKMHVTFAALGAWAIVAASYTASDKNKDAVIMKAAIESAKAPENINAGGDVNVNQGASTPVPLAGSFNESDGSVVMDELPLELEYSSGLDPQAAHELNVRAIYEQERENAGN